MRRTKEGRNQKLHKITAYYNEIDNRAAAWLRQLIKNGNITPGEVDERSITEVEARDLQGFDRVHFFAGIGTWDYCLNQAGWGDRPIWTASLPCQPFSAAGKGLGKADERHLLPHFLELVKECKPATVLGEQVAAAIKHGWLDDLYAEMEACDYALGSAVIGAHSIGAPHIRQRLYWVADSHEQRSQGRERIKCPDQFITGENGMVGGLGITNSTGSQQGIETPKAARYGGSIEPTGSISGMANSKNSGFETPSSECNEQFIEWSADAFATYSGVEWIYCRDNKYRPVKPGIQPLVDGVTGGMVYSSDPSEPINANATQEARAMRLKGYGNAIQAQTAIAFIRAYLTL